MFNKDTTTGKTVRTLIQAVAGLALVLLADPTVRNWVFSNQPALLVYLPLAVALATAVHNYLDPSVPNV